MKQIKTWEELTYNVHLWNKLMNNAKCEGLSLHCTEYTARLHGSEYRLCECGSDLNNLVRSIEILKPPTHDILS